MRYRNSVPCLWLITSIALIMTMLVLGGCVPPTLQPPASPGPTKPPLATIPPGSFRDCVLLDDLNLGTNYKVSDTFTDSGTTLTVLPFQWSNGTWISTGDGAEVQNAVDVGGSGKELFINNVNLGLNVAPAQCISLRFHDKGGNVNLVVNNQVGNYPDFVDTNLGGIKVAVARDAPDKNSGVLTLSGKFESLMFQEKWPINFAIGGQELAIDHLCPCEAAMPTAEVTAISKEETAQIVLETVAAEMLRGYNQNLGLRVNQYPEPLPKASEIRPALPEESRAQVMTCNNACWLFLIDKDPLAHFAHPVEIITIDSMTGEVTQIKTEWWPEVNGSPVFNTLESRTDPEQTILYRQPLNYQIPKHELPANMNVIVQGACSETDSCHTWAIIVCGYDDLPDTFDEDTDGMYAVLHGLGVPDDHIFFVSPHTTHPGVDQATSVANVQWAINQVAGLSSPADRVLFFYSSHGGVDSLSCVPGSTGGGYISAAQLAGWLNGISTANLSIVIEACHSGSLIGRYQNGTYVASEDDLTGHGEINRIVFTSASSDTSSYPDLDGPGDPNPGDAGSETLWGYVEAFITSSADTNNDGGMSVGEAFQLSVRAFSRPISRIDLRDSNIALGPRIMRP